MEQAIMVAAALIGAGITMGLAAIGAGIGDDFDIEKYIKDNNLEQIDDTDTIRREVLNVFASNPGAVKQYMDGQTKVIGFFVGQIMKAMRGKAKPDTVNKIVIEELSKL